MFPNFESPDNPSDEGKTKEQLRRELADVRSRLRKLENIQIQYEQSESALLESQHLVRKITNTLPQVLYIFDLSQGQITYINDQFTEILGYDVQDLYDQGLEWLATHIHPDDRYLLHDVARRFLTLSDKAVLTSEYRLQHRDGEWRWFSNREVVFNRDETGIPTQVLGSVLDITHRKQTEAALRQSEAALREAQFLAHVGSWGFDVATATTTWSEETFRIFGLDPAQPQPTHAEFLQWIYADDRPAFEQFLERAMRDGIFSEIEYRLVRSSGSVRYINMRVEGTFDYEGQVTGLFGVVSDITERRRLEQLLRSQAEREQLLSVVTQRIHQSLNLDEILTTAVTEVRHTLQADRALIFRLQDGVGAVIKRAILPDYPIGTQLLPLEQCQPAEPPDFYRYHHPQIINDVATDEWASCLAGLMQDESLKSEVVIPIVQNANGSSQIWGLLIVQSCSVYRHWQADEVELLQHIGDQLAIAIQQSELYQQVQHFNLNLEHQVQQRTVELQAALYYEAVLKRITDAVRDSLDERQILQTAVEELALALRVNCCDTGLYSPDKRISTISYDYTSQMQSAQGQIVYTEGFPAVYERLFEGQCLHFSSLPAHSDQIRPDAAYATILACPIHDDREVLGDLWLRKTQGDVFDEQEIRLVQQVANQCAIALRQSRLYQASQAQVQELEQLNRLKDDFLSTISHELRTPLTNMKMATQMLELTLEQLDILNSETTPQARVDRYFDILKTECQREINLVNDLLDLNRLEAGVEPLTLTEIRLQSLIPQVVSGFVSRIQAQQQHLEIDIPAQLPPLVADLSYLERILMELLNNACKYTASGETIAIVASVDSAASTLMVQVSNTGVEIPIQERDRIFERFYRVPSHDPWRHGGTGLGLALVKKMVERLGATIEVTCATQQTTFALTLPLAL